MKRGYTIVTTTAPHGEKAHHAVSENARTGIIRGQLEDGRPVEDALDGIACDFFRVEDAERYVEGLNAGIVGRIGFAVAHPGVPGIDEREALRWAAPPLREAA